MLPFIPAVSLNALTVQMSDFTSIDPSPITTGWYKHNIVVLLRQQTTGQLWLESTGVKVLQQKTERDNCGNQYTVSGNQQISSTVFCSVQLYVKE